MAKASRGSDQFPLRMPPGMREQIKRAAEESGRSMNSEILEALRDSFPEEPSLEELVDAIDFSAAMLRHLQAETDDVTKSPKYLSLLGRLEETNYELVRSLRKAGRVSPVVVLDREVVESLRRELREWDLPDHDLQAFANGLIQMGIDRVRDGQEPMRIWIGEGETRRMVEFSKPSESTDK